MTISENVNQVSFSWSLGQDLTEDLQVFVTGATEQSVPGESAGTQLAFGSFWRCSDWLMYFGLMGWGVTPDAPKLIAQVGLGIAFGRVQSH